MLYFKIFSDSNGTQSVISQGKYYNPSSLLSEILKEPDNREEWLGVSGRPVSVLTLVDKSERILVVSFLCIINSSQGTNHFFFYWTPQHTKKYTMSKKHRKSYKVSTLKENRKIAINYKVVLRTTMRKETDAR